MEEYVKRKCVSLSICQINIELGESKASDEPLYIRVNIV